jgi:hypothetical protein
MAYSAPEDLHRAYPKVLTAGLTQDAIVAAIAFADAYIDGLLGARYPVPFAPTPDTTPPLIRALSWTLALGLVYDRSPQTPDWVTRAVARAELVLGRLAAGELAVIGPTGAPVATRTDTNMPASSVDGFTPVFGAVPSLSEGYDPDRADAEAFARK